MLGEASAILIHLADSRPDSGTSAVRHAITTSPVRGHVGVGIRVPIRLNVPEPESAPAQRHSQSPAYLDSSTLIVRGFWSTLTRRLRQTAILRVSVCVRTGVLHWIESNRRA